jgi:hypothetical protein
VEGEKPADLPLQQRRPFYVPVVGHVPEDPLRLLRRGSAKRFSTGREPAARGVYPPRRTCRPGVVELGVLTIDKAVPDSLEAQKKLLFLPG